MVAACRPGKRAVLCEKPFTTGVAESSSVARASAETGDRRHPVLVPAQLAQPAGRPGERAAGFALGVPDGLPLLEHPAGRHQARLYLHGPSLGSFVVQSVLTNIELPGWSAAQLAALAERLDATNPEQ